MRNTRGNILQPTSFGAHCMGDGKLQKKIVTGTAPKLKLMVICVLHNGKINVSADVKFDTFSASFSSVVEQCLMNTVVVEVLYIFRWQAKIIIYKICVRVCVRMTLASGEALLASLLITAIAPGCECWSTPPFLTRTCCSSSRLPGSSSELYGPG